jgi:hypothetical protein
MAFDFPASPTIGQVSNGYTYNGYGWIGGPGVYVEAPNDAYQYLRGQNAWNSGGTLSGDLTISKANAGISLEKAASTQGCYITTKMNALPRWQMVIGDAVAESGSNVGSNFIVNRFNDAGTYLDAPLAINRATGVVTASGLAPIPTAAGVGQWTNISAYQAPLILPAGGTWAYVVMGWTNALVWSLGPNAGLAAGGTTIATAPAANTYGGFCWRIA